MRHLAQQPHIWLWFPYKYLWFYFEAFGSTTPYMTLIPLQMSLVPFQSIQLNNPIYGSNTPTNVSGSVLRHLALQLHSVFGSSTDTAFLAGFCYRYLQSATV